MNMPWDSSLGHRSVVNEVTRFCGFNELENLLVSIESDVKPSYIEPTKLLVLCLFKSGGRISEVLSLNTRQFETTNDFLFIHNMPVLKKRSTRQIDVFRDVPILMTEELTDKLLSLLPNDGRLFDFKYNKAYKLIASLEQRPDEKHGAWFPHRFRAERARQLIRDHGFDALLLKQFFNMSRIDTPLTYANPTFEAVKTKMLSRA